MLFKKITLNNIGPYEGFNSFALASNHDKNVTIIGGKNGAGKTTLLTSVRLALYGPLAYGFKTESSEYIKKVSSLLNNKSFKSKQNNFSIQLDFSMVEDFKRIKISIIRSWDFTNNRIKEKVAVIKGSSHLNELEKDLFFEDLRTSFPPSLLELCLFDGEEISQLTNDNKLSNYLHELSTKIFNLDLFQNLEYDLNNYLSQSSRSQEETKLEEERDILSEDIHKKVRHLKQLHETIEIQENQLTSFKNRYSEIKHEFSLHGGMLMGERNKTMEKINTLETDRKYISEQVKEFIARDLPFFLSLPRLIELVNQLRQEENYHISNILKDKISNLPIDDIIENLGVKSNQEKESILKQDLINKLTQSDEITIIHNASKTEAQQVYSLLSSTNLVKLNEISKLIQSSKNKLTQIQKIRRQLKDNDSSPEFKDMIIKMEDHNKKIVELETELVDLRFKLELLQEDVDTLNKKYDRVQHNLYNIQKTKSSFGESQKIINISRSFQEKQLRNKVKDVEYFSSKMFKDLLRKKSFINQIKINHVNFHLKILDSNNDEINKDILSAGEKQLLVLSIIWGTIIASQKELPFILDTLLGRLDIEHKHSIITKLIPKFGSQTIILSTDSEINQELYSSLSEVIANEYTLNYDTANKSTKIEKHFFNLDIKEKVNS